MKRLLAVSTIVAGAMFFHPPAFAANTNFTGIDSVTGNTGVGVAGTGGFTDPVPLNNSISNVFNLFTLNPDGTCDGPGCTTKLDKHGHTVIDPLGTDTELLTFVIKPPSSGTAFEGFNFPQLTLTGTYTASYSGPELGCAVGDNKSPLSGETDCFAWTGATNTNFNGTLTVDRQIGNTGATLELVFHNTSDWSITPTVTAQIIPAAIATPEPYSIALLAAGLLGTLAVRRRQRR
jgi:hypothetical protein